MGEKLLSYLFLKNQIEHMYGSTVWNFIKFVFIVCPRRGLRKYIEIKVLTTCFYFTYRKQKEDWNLSPWLSWKSLIRATLEMWKSVTLLLTKIL